ncbi:MAG: 3'-5' exonuclease [Candidatus Thorarchaeota archaeon]|jgi:exodeoxyribonuclease VIII
MIDFMVDLETLDNGPTAVVVQIGAVAFERDTGEIVSEFLTNVSIGEQLEDGFTVNGSTIKWWMGQTVEGKNTWYDKRAEPAKTAFIRLNNFLNEHASKKSVVWSHSTFDAPIIFHHFNKYDIYNAVRYAFWLDLRTLSMLGRGVASIPQDVRPDDAHDALADCKYQVKWLVKCWNALKGK